MQIAVDPKEATSGDVGGPDMLPCRRHADGAAPSGSVTGFDIAGGVPPRVVAHRIRNPSERWGRSDRGGRPVSDALTDDGGDAVLTHRHAVEGIGDLHRALLVRDDQQLRALP